MAPFEISFFEDTKIKIIDIDKSSNIAKRKP